MARTFSILTLTAGLSSPSSTRMLADQLTTAARAELSRDGSEVTTRTIELREHAHEITDALLSHFPGERLREVVEAVRSADAVIAVTPIFNVGPSGLFKMFVDALDKELWHGKPVLLGATAGTARHSLTLDYAIRPMFSYLRAEIVPTGVFAASGDFGAAGATEADADPLADRARRAGRELAAMLEGGLGRGGEGPADGTDLAASSEGPTAAGARGLDPEFADFVPMGTLLDRSGPGSR